MGASIISTTVDSDFYSYKYNTMLNWRWNIIISYKVCVQNAIPTWKSADIIF